mgnify:FL=1
MSRAYLLLENGMVFEGEGFGAAGTRVGELVFTTGMTGCAESLTDPSYRGQLIPFTFPMLGNYGICYEDRESPHIHARAVVVREFCPQPSNFRAEVDVDTFLREEGVCGICGVDTRRITQLIRDKGVMNAAVTNAEPDDALLELVRAHRVSGVVDEVTVKEPVLLAPRGEARHSVALLDFGYKRSIADCLTARGCAVTLYPAKTPAEQIIAAGHDGVMLSNGPGDPTDNQYSIEQIKILMDALPTFGICLGHQMMALAAGARTRKMKFGHRGANQPAKDLETGRVYVTSQNHGYAVDNASLPGSGAVMRFVNVNDGSCEGLDYPGKRAFSLQFHPEAHGGPLDCSGMFERFISMMGGGENA